MIMVLDLRSDARTSGCSPDRHYVIRIIYSKTNFFVQSLSVYVLYLDSKTQTLYFVFDGNFSDILEK